VDRTADVPLLNAARSNRILAALPEPALNRILHDASLVDLPHGRRIYREDAQVDSLYFPLNGVVVILAHTPLDHAVVTATVGNEGVLGVGVTTGAHRSLGRKIVQVEGRAVAFPARQFTKHLHREPQLELLMNRYVDAFVRESLLGSACNRIHTVEERCARCLLMTSDRVGEGPFRITQDAVAGMIGTRRAKANTALAALRRDGAIEYVYKQIKIVNRALLETFSCPCYRLTRATYAHVRI
jgi:CRP-like cAMP-binding protein